MSDPRELERPSSHPLPEEGTPDPATWTLRVEGLVRRPASFTVEELERLGDASHTGEFTCELGWREGDKEWQGAPLARVLEIVEPLPEATALYSYAPGYRALIPLEAAATAILATRLDGRPLSRERGAPCRLVVPDRSCQLSVKWVGRLELFTRKRDQQPGPRKPEPIE